MNTAAESHLPPDVLEKHAAEQRQRIHQSVDELRTTLHDTIRERLDVKRYARQYFSSIAMGVSFVGFLAGYGMAGMFTRR